MNKYTIILNFRKGIYVSQHMATDINDAILKWAINIDDIKYLGACSKTELIALMKEKDTAILLKGMDNVWCISGLLKTGFFMANIVKS